MYVIVTLVNFEMRFRERLNGCVQQNSVLGKRSVILHYVIGVILLLDLAKKLKARTNHIWESLSAY